MTVRRVALALGVAFAALTAIELLVGDWALGGTAIILRTTKLNLLHWAVALSFLGGRFAGPAAARVVTWVVGGALLGLGLWGLLAPAGLGAAFGFGTSIPWSYTVFHLLTSGVALSGAFISRRKAA